MDKPFLNYETFMDLGMALGHVSVISHPAKKIQIINTSYLHRHWEVALGLWWEENIHGFLLERRVPRWRSSHLNDKNPVYNGKNKLS